MLIRGLFSVPSTWFDSFDFAQDRFAHHRPLRTRFDFDAGDLGFGGVFDFQEFSVRFEDVCLVKNRGVVVIIAFA